jgi:hypothetical protein
VGLKRTKVKICLEKKVLGEDSGRHWTCKVTNWRNT